MVPGAGNVIYTFPRQRRSEPEDATLHDIAPSHALVASILEERELPAADLHAAFREPTARQALLLESTVDRRAGGERGDVGRRHGFLQPGPELDRGGETEPDQFSHRLRRCRDTRLRCTPLLQHHRRIGVSSVVKTTS